MTSAIKSLIMKNSWELARRGAKKFGGVATDYFSQALILCWKDSSIRKALKREKLNKIYFAELATKRIADRGIARNIPSYIASGQGKYGGDRYSAAVYGR